MIAPRIEQQIMKHGHTLTATVEELDAVLTIRAHQELAEWVADRAAAGKCVVVSSCSPELVLWFLRRVHERLTSLGKVFKFFNKAGFDEDGNVEVSRGIESHDAWVRVTDHKKLSWSAAGKVQDVTVLLHELRYHTQYMNQDSLGMRRSRDVDSFFENIYGSVFVNDAGQMDALNQFSLWTKDSSL